jgi:arylsulfatase A-like enzyme
MISGVYPHEHGAMKQSDEPDESEGLTLPPRMDDSRETITEALAGAGYETYGGFGHDTPFVALAGRFQTHALYHKATSDARDVLEDYLDWVQGRDRTFSFLHLADPHIPVDPPQEYWEAHDVDSSIANIENWEYNQTVDCDDACRRYREHRRRLYRASVDYVDDVLSEFDEKLTERLEDPLLVVTSDHGEAMWEHLEYDVENFDGTGCVDHGGAPYEQLARVPLLTNADWDFEGHTSLIDLAPTFARLAGIDGPDMTGVPLTESSPEDRMVHVEGSLSGYEKKAIYHDQYKLIVSKGDNIEEGYTLPEEQRVTIPEESRERMLRELPPWPDGSAATTEVSGVVEDRLNQLGYK